MTSPPNGDWDYFGSEITDGSGRVLFQIPEHRQLPAGMYPVKIVVRADHSTADLTLAVLPPRTETVVFSVDGSFAASVSLMGKDPKVRPGAVDVVRHWQELGFLLIYITARPDLQHRKVVTWLAQHNFPHGMVLFMDGLSHDPMRQKTQLLARINKEAGVVFHAAYGSAKDVSVYQGLSLEPHRIFIVGKPSRKQAAQCTVIAQGYAAHLNELLRAHELSRNAQGNARFVIRRGCFVLPSKLSTKFSRKKSSRGHHHHPTAGAGGEDHQSSYDAAGVAAPEVGVSVSVAGNTVLDAGQARAAAKQMRGLPAGIQNR